MLIRKTQEDEAIILAIEGKLSTITSQQLQDELMPAFDQSSRVILDFQGVEYVASAGLRVLFSGYETATSKSAEMILRGVTDDIMEIFEMTGFVDFLTIEQ